MEKQFLKKAISIFSRGQLCAFQFEASHHQDYPVMCMRWKLSGYDAWRKREPSQHRREDAELVNKIKGAFKNQRCVYGSPRIHAELHGRGIHHSIDQFEQDLTIPEVQQDAERKASLAANIHLFETMIVDIE